MTPDEHAEYRRVFFAAKLKELDEQDARAGRRSRLYSLLSIVFSGAAIALAARLLGWL